MKTLTLEQWCSLDRVRAVLDFLLSRAAENLVFDVNYILQIHGETFLYDKKIKFIQLYSDVKDFGNEYTVVADLQALPFCYAQFDIVIFLFPYETLQLNLEMITEISRVLRPGGVLMVFGVNCLSLEGICDSLGIKRFPFDLNILKSFYSNDIILEHGFSQIAHYEHGFFSQTNNFSRPKFRTYKDRQDVEDVNWLIDLIDGVITLDLYQIVDAGFVVNSVVMA